MRSRANGPEKVEDVGVTELVPAPLGRPFEPAGSIAAALAT